ncbi:MAG: hypothetical protein RMJ52_03735 [Gemmataceae bacterium]|nr:hypothetical protein [Gemmataceae bacterium]
MSAGKLPRGWSRAVMISGLAGVCVVVVGLAYWLFSSWGGSLSRDLQYLPDNCHIIGSLRIEQIRTSPSWNYLKTELSKELAKDLPMETDQFSSLVENLIGVPVDQVAQVIVGGTLGSDMTPDLVVVIRTNKPVTTSQIEGRKKELSFQKVSVGKHTVYAASDVAFCVPEQQVVLWAKSADTFKKILERTGRPQISDGMQQALKQIDFSQSLALAINYKDLGAVLAQAAKSTGPVMFDVNEIFDFNWSLATTYQIQLDKTISLVSTAICRDKEAARESKVLADAMLVLLKRLKIFSKELQDILASYECNVSGTTATMKLTATPEQLVGLVKNTKTKIDELRNRIQLPGPNPG